MASKSIARQSWPILAIGCNRTSPGQRTKPKPRWMPLPELLYAQVVKSYRRRRLVGSNTAWCSAPSWPSSRVLAACGWTINTAFVEAAQPRSVSGWRRSGAGSTRCARAKRACGIRLVLFQVYHNFVLPHASLRQPCAEPMSHQRPWLGQDVAAVHTGDGGGLDRPCVVAQRGAVLPGAAVAPGTEGLKQEAG